MLVNPKIRVNEARVYEKSIREQQLISLFKMLKKSRKSCLRQPNMCPRARFWNYFKFFPIPPKYSKLYLIPPWVSMLWNSFVMRATVRRRRFLGRVNFGLVCRCPAWLLEIIWVGAPPCPGGAPLRSKSTGTERDSGACFWSYSMSLFVNSNSMFVLYGTY
jgi:hypothetical protein